MLGEHTFDASPISTFLSIESCHTLVSTDVFFWNNINKHSKDNCYMKDSTRLQILKKPSHMYLCHCGGDLVFRSPRFLTQVMNWTLCFPNIQELQDNQGCSWDKEGCKAGTISSSIHKLQTRACRLNMTNEVTREHKDTGLQNGWTDTVLLEAEMEVGIGQVTVVPAAQ